MGNSAVVTDGSSLRVYQAHRRFSSIRERPPAKNSCEENIAESLPGVRALRQFCRLGKTPRRYAEFQAVGGRGQGTAPYAVTQILGGTWLVAHLGCRPSARRR